MDLTKMQTLALASAAQAKAECEAAYAALSASIGKKRSDVADALAMYEQELSDAKAACDSACAVWSELVQEVVKDPAVTILSIDAVACRAVVK